MRRMVSVVGCVACLRRRVSSDLGRSSFRTVFVRRFWSGSSDREKVAYFGGERGIRTLEGLLTLTPLAGVRLRPLGHLSAAKETWLLEDLMRRWRGGNHTQTHTGAAKRARP